MKEFTQNGITLVFYQKPNDEKFSFLIKDNEELTEKLLASVKTKRVKETNIKYAVNGIFNKIAGGDFTKKQKVKNPIAPINYSSCERVTISAFCEDYSTEYYSFYYGGSLEYSELVPKVNVIFIEGKRSQDFGKGLQCRYFEIPKSLYNVLKGGKSAYPILY